MIKTLRTNLIVQLLNYNYKFTIPNYNFRITCPLFVCHIDDMSTPDTYDEISLVSFSDFTDKRILKEVIERRAKCMLRTRE